MGRALLKSRIAAQADSLRKVGLRVGWLLALASCAADLRPGSAYVGDASAGDSATGGDAAVTATGPITGPLKWHIKNRAVTLEWEEDEHLYHCLDIVQPRPGKPTPLKVSFCPPKPAQTSVTLGDADDQGHPLPGIDYQWIAMQDFVPGAATWSVRGGMEPTGKKVDVSQGTMTIGQHFNGPCQGKADFFVGLTEFNDKPPVTMDITANVSQPARKAIDLITPGILVESVNAQGTSALKFKYTFKQRGMYTVEVNNTGGGAILNCAVYIDADVPLAPVEVTGGSGLVDAPSAEKLATMRKKLLDLTNAERAKVGLAALELDDKLNEIAQFHSDDMSKQGYFAHNDPAGNGPGERAIQFGYSGGIGENLAANMSLEGAHNGLFWSAGHRGNMLSKSWKHAGFGIAKAPAPNKTMLVTENFGDQ